MLGNGGVRPWAGRMPTLCTRRCSALPCPCCSPLSAATLVPRRGQPDLWGTLLPCHGATPSCSPSACSRFNFLFLGGCRAGPGQLRVSYRVGGYRAKGPGLCGCRGQLDTGPWRGTSSFLVLPGRRRRDEAGASVLAHRVAQIPQWCRGPWGQALTAVLCRTAWLQLGHCGCWQQGREQASPLSEAIFRCWREAEER